MKNLQLRLEVLRVRAKELTPFKLNFARPPIKRRVVHRGQTSV